MHGDDVTGMAWVPGRQRGAKVRHLAEVTLLFHTFSQY